MPHSYSVQRTADGACTGRALERAMSASGREPGRQTAASGQERPSQRCKPGHLHVPEPIEARVTGTRQSLEPYPTLHPIAFNFSFTVVGSLSASAH